MINTPTTPALAPVSTALPAPACIGPTTKAQPQAIGLAAHGSAPAVLLDVERLDAYRVALELQALCSTLVPAKERVLRDQLERASVSVCLNLAEGAGRRGRGEKRRFYSYARGSATECGAVIDILRIRRLADEGSLRQARALVVRVVQMMTRLEAAVR